MLDLSTGNIVHTIRHNNKVYFVTFSPNNRYLATASEDHTAQLLDLSTGNIVHTIRHDSPISSIYFSPNSKTLFTKDSSENLYITPLPQALTIPQSYLLYVLKRLNHNPQNLPESLTPLWESLPELYKKI